MIPAPTPDLRTRGARPRPRLLPSAALVGLGLLLLCGRARAEEPAPAGQPPAGQAPAKAAPKAGQALDVVERHAVLVTIAFQKDLEAEEHGALPPNPRSTSEVYRLWRMTMVVPGFVVRDHRTVLCSDPWIPPGAIASLTVRPLTGAPVKARLRGFLARAEAVVLEAESDLPVDPVPFPAAGAPAPEAALVGSVAEGARGVESWVDGLGTLRRRVGSPHLALGMVDAPTDGLDPDPASRTVDLVFAAGAVPVGFRFGGGMDVDEGIWRGADVLADREVPFTELEERERSLATRRTRARVEVVLRTTKRDDREDEGFGGDDDGEDRLEHWGFAVSPEVLVVPGRLEPDQVRRLESVRHKVDDGPGREARYLGKVKGLDAYLVEVKGAGFEPLKAERRKVPGIGAAIQVHHTAWRGGARRDQLDYDRIVGRGRRYGDRLHLAVERPVEEGALLLDLEGGVLGFAARLDPEDKEDRLGGREVSRRERPQYPLMAVLFEEVGLPATLAEDPDVRVMPQEETESKRLPWLGVESTGFTKEVAEMLDISAATRDGKRGLLVGRVYAGSPAARAGVEVGDILLSARRTSGPGAGLPPIDLAEERRGGWFNPWTFLGGGGEDAPQPWTSQDTPLNRLLKTWGEGTTFELVFLRAKEQRTASLRVEVSPPTYDSAPRARDEGTGLTVRDLTFEVRAALRLVLEAPGVVVARVEPGSPAAQARIGKNELIQEVDGTAVEDAAGLVARLEAARAAGRANVRLVVRRLDKTRLVDLGLAPSEERAASNR